MQISVKPSKVGPYDLAWTDNPNDLPLELHALENGLVGWVVYWQNTKLMSPGGALPRLGQLTYQLETRHWLFLWEAHKLAPDGNGDERLTRTGADPYELLQRAISALRPVALAARQAS